MLRRMVYAVSSLVERRCAGKPAIFVVNRLETILVRVSWNLWYREK
jgi:hypothetical protein